MLLPVAGRLLKYLLPPFFKQQHGPVRFIHQVSDMDPQVLGLISLGNLAACHPWASIGLPNLYEQRCRLRYQLWQVWGTVPQAKPGISAQLVKLFQFFEGLVHQPPVSTGRGLGSSWDCCRHNFAVACLEVMWIRNDLKCQGLCAFLCGGVTINNNGRAVFFLRDSKAECVNDY